MLKRTLIMSALSLSVATAAFADESNMPNGVYFGASIGMGKIGLSDKDQTRSIVSGGSSNDYTVNSTSERFAGNVHAGSIWKLNNYFGLGGQLGVTYWGSYDLNGVSPDSGSVGASQQTLNLSIVGQFSPFGNLYLEGRAGVAFNISSVNGTLYTDSSGSNPAKITNRHKSAPVLGGSIGYNFNKNIQMYLAGDGLLADDFKDSYVGSSQRMIKAAIITIGFNYNIGP